MGGRPSLVHRPLPAGRLQAVQRVQAHLASQGFPSPRPLAGPSPIGNGIGTAESLLLGGSIVDAHSATEREVLARGLCDLVCQACPQSTQSGRWADGDWPYRLARGEPARKQPRIVAIYDWESLALLPEPVLVGAVGRIYVGRPTKFYRQLLVINCSR